MWRKGTSVGQITPTKACITMSFMKLDIVFCGRCVLVSIEGVVAHDPIGGFFPTDKVPL